MGLFHGGILALRLQKDRDSSGHHSSHVLCLPIAVLGPLRTSSRQPLLGEFSRKCRRGIEAAGPLFQRPVLRQQPRQIAGPHPIRQPWHSGNVLIDVSRVRGCFEMETGVSDRFLGVKDRVGLK